LPKVLRGEAFPPDQIFYDQGPPATEFFFLSRVEIIAERQAEIILKIRLGHKGLLGFFGSSSKGFEKKRPTAVPSASTNLRCFYQQVFLHLQRPLDTLTILRIFMTGSFLASCDILFLKFKNKI
jgi:hypothetical protein